MGQSRRGRRDGTITLSDSAARTLQGYLSAYQTHWRTLAEISSYATRAMRSAFDEIERIIRKSRIELLEGERRIDAELQAWLHSGSLESDFWLIYGVANTTKATGEDRWGAYYRIASSVSIYFRDPAARQRIAEEIKHRGKDDTVRWLREEILPTATMLVFDTIEHPRQIRVGRRWLNGRRQSVAPDEAFVFVEESCRAWIKQEIKNAAEADLLGREYPTDSTSATGGRPRTILSPREARQLLLSLATISPRQRELLEHLAAGVPARALSEVLAVKASTVGVMLHSIRAKQRRA